MKYNNPELIERLSAEYVLGTLQGKARDRFEHLMENSHRIRMAVWNWENHITPIAAAAPAHKTPYHLWPGIKTRIGQPTQTDNNAQRESAPNLVAGFWRWWGLAATAACLVLGVIVGLRPATLPPAQIIDSVAVFSNEQAQPQWLVSFDMDSGQLKARALNDIAVEAGRAFELWVLPESGNPRSLGLLPVSGAAGAEVDNSIPLALIELLRTANGLAVSIEPEGGSPTGLPTGPVVYQSSLLNL